ncbi:Long-chain base-1-phosphate phosphatase [Kickxella alabastrina]|uniref:Long-chain base-1-phosphate phosphatase n=1 Tax=Kickxella alabastrina TaxID=61397 RepID=A0ACC1ILS7_9FUNG|nr:Long-chain base-1-phosphate phosphatase [Kickxella alabastrina]
MAHLFQLDEDDDPTHEAAVFVKVPEHVYAAVYSPLRQKVRQAVAREVEREMAALVEIQRRYRSDVLDTLFVLTGMLGNHAFFMLALPFLHVFGGGQFARGLTFVVLWSIYFSGWVKDYVSAPRPASPPIAQITRSPAHTFEYGFPSSHTTYVVATILYISHFMMHVWGSSLVSIVVFWAVGVFIVVGRIYCGLHSFIDIVGGIGIGVVEALGFVAFYPRIDALLLSTPGPLYMAVVLYLALKNIPRSLDLCPCCVDSFCATSVTLGLAVGTWVHARTPFLWHNGVVDSIAWDSSLTPAQNALRCSIVLVLVVAWKLGSKAPMIALVQGLSLCPVPCCDGADGSKLDIGAEIKPECTDTLLDSISVKPKLSEENAAYIKDYLVPSPGSIAAGHYGTHKLMVTPENFVRVPIYAGLGIVIYVAAPMLFYLLGLMPA